MENQIHARYYDAFGTTPTEDEIMDIYHQLPSRIKFLAEEWGWNDTEVREDVGLWINENYERKTL